MQRSEDDLTSDIRSVDILDQFGQKGGIGHSLRLDSDMLGDRIRVELVPNERREDNLGNYVRGPSTVKRNSVSYGVMDLRGQLTCQT